MYYAGHDSPIGALWVAGSDEGVHHVSFVTRSSPETSWRHDPHAARAVLEQLDSYFAGELRRFELLLAPRGTAFQRAVWTELARIGYGDTTSYAALAAGIGRPDAARAVGAANGRNPLAIVLPCHRVIGKSGRLTGYAGGLAAKRWLLEHERQRSQRLTSRPETAMFAGEP